MNQTTKTAQELRKELDKSAQLLRTLRDDIRLQLHLGTLDAKAEWNRLEPRLEATLVRAGREISDASRDAVDDVVAAARRLRESLKH